MFRLPGGLALAALLLCACCTAAPAHRAPEPAAPALVLAQRNGGAAAGEREAARRLHAGQRLVAQGEYAQALPRLAGVVSDFPESASAREALYSMGVASQEIGALTDALHYFGEYLRASPEGPHAADAKQRLEALSAGGQAPPTQQARDARAESARIAAEARPDDATAQSDHADALWEAGRYAEAGAVYEKLLAARPALAEDMTIRSRIERQPDGRYVVLTPDETARRLAQAQPLLIVNTASFTSGRGTLAARSGRDIYYNVTGEAINRSQEPLRSVQIFVTIKGFGDTIFDTQAVNLGTLRPGEKRAFSVRFSNFDNLDNVSRFTCESSFER